MRVRPGEVALTAVRAGGPGGQNVNKVSNAAHLRFDVHASSLPAEVKTRLLALGDRRVSADGVVVIKSQAHRSLEMNKADALARLDELVTRAAARPRPRLATRPGRAAKARRVNEKKQRGAIKAARRARYDE